MPLCFEEEALFSSITEAEATRLSNIKVFVYGQPKCAQVRRACRVPIWEHPRITYWPYGTAYWSRYRYSSLATFMNLYEIVPEGIWRRTVLGCVLTLCILLDNYNGPTSHAGTQFHRSITQPEFAEIR